LSAVSEADVHTRRQFWVQKLATAGIGLALPLWLAGCDPVATIPAEAPDARDAEADLAVTDVPSDTTATADPLVGTWNFSGSVPAIVKVAFTLNADKTFSFVEDVAPPTWPAGYVPNGCVTTDTFLGTYAATASTLTLTVTGGTDNAVHSCNNPATNTPGVPMTAADVSALSPQGLFPPPTVSYTLADQHLTLTAPGGSTSTTYSR
jgi:hypothetical protein